jgi:acetyl esterase/lipase
MKKLIVSLSSGFLLTLMTTSMTHAQNPKSTIRYKDEIFSSIKTDTAIQYAQNINLYGSQQKLLADVYSPASDTGRLRPLIIFMHGGAFVSGNRKDDYVVQFCQAFARKGYVTASLDYRMGVQSAYSPVDYGDAIYRSVQDAKAAVRYFRANAEQYGIDPARIFIGGGSAGAITALHVAYWRQENVPFYLSVSKLGKLEDAGGSTGVSSEVQAVINCWGALIDTNYIRKGDAPVVSIHGENDPVVPYKATALGIYSLYGSYFIQQRAERLDIKSELLPFPNTGHGFLPGDTDKWNASVRVITDFLYDIIQDKAEGTNTDTTTQQQDTTSKDTTTHTGIHTQKEEYSSSFSIYPNPVSSQLKISNGRNVSVCNIRLLSINGKEEKRWTSNISSQDTRVYEIPGLSSGVYLVSVLWMDGREETSKIVVR